MKRPLRNLPLAADERFHRIGAALDAVRARCDVGDRLARDPVGVLHRYADPLDQEIVGILGSSIAFGNMVTIRAKLDDALARLGPSPARAADDEKAVHAALRGWVHRVFRGEDIARLVVGAREVQREAGTLGAAFARELALRSAPDALRDTLARWSALIRDRGGLARSAAKTKRRGPAHLLPDSYGSSGSKRLLLYLRWMVRPADGVDLGLWTGLVPPSILLIPVDTHIYKLARNLGFTQRRDLSWQTTVEITSVLSRFDRDDPVKYDFALCHMGMLQRCPSRKDEARCEGCGVKSVCRHWPLDAGAPSVRRSRSR
jgi:uncharacterized protein (TIGR02757 family)